MENISSSSQAASPPTGPISDEQKRKANLLVKLKLPPKKKYRLAAAKDKDGRKRKHKQTKNSSKKTTPNDHDLSEDNTPLSLLFHKRKQHINQTQHSDSDIYHHPLEISKVPESIYVDKECCQKLQMEKQILTLELTCTKLQMEMQKLASELAFSNARDEKREQELVHFKESYHKLQTEMQILRSKPAFTKSPVEEPEQELEYVPKECYQKLLMENQELTSELTYARSKEDELLQELELSEARTAHSEEETYVEKKAVKRLRKTVQNLKSDSARCHDKIISEFKRSKPFLEFCERMKDDAVKEYIKFNFRSAVREESNQQYRNGFNACKLQLLNCSQLPEVFNFDFLDPNAGILGEIAFLVP